MAYVPVSPDPGHSGLCACCSLTQVTVAYVPVSPDPGHSGSCICCSLTHVTRGFVAIYSFTNTAGRPATITVE